MEEVDDVLIAIAPRKQPIQTISMPPSTLGVNENLLVASFVNEAGYQGLLLSLDLLDGKARGRVNFDYLRRFEFSDSPNARRN